MSLLKFQSVFFLIYTVVIFCSVHARWEEATLEAQWRKINPKPYHCPNHWDEAQRLTHEQHKRICDDILLQTMDHYKGRVVQHFTYVNATDIVKERVATMPVDFLHGIGDTLEMTLVLCRYKETEFYLAQGEYDSVFKMVRDPSQNRGIIFKSGLHRILYDPYKHGENTAFPDTTYTIPVVGKYEHE